MSEYTTFPNAPITEALLDIRVELPTEVTLSKLENFHNHIKERFPEKEQRMSLKGGLRLSQGMPESLPITGGPDGYLIKSLADKKIVQVRLDGFTFNKLKPYENWDIFCSEARELWNLYFQANTPVKITRIALRYINRIEIPLPIKDFKEYILTTPEIAPNLPQGLSSFFMQLVIPNPDIEANAIITQTMENPTGNRLPLILDIDVFKEINYTDNKAEMWDEFKKLRSFKNEIFFNSITKKAEELFK
ncbi:MAG: hypothetical protein A3D97_03675 [Nitrospinae bacterium RIFCSPHIGHO2_12_FULL_39_42]|nr:MAG: hypothetical protein A3D97_03675 [Nitrospinae bacterium RIFCSPHIGHO2_12_FULL_39_42]